MDRYLHCAASRSIPASPDEQLASEIAGGTKNCIGTRIEVAQAAQLMLSRNTKVIEQYQTLFTLSNDKKERAGEPGSFVPL